MASFNLKVEDSSPLFSFSPAGAWSDNPNPQGLSLAYSGNAYHSTTVQGASATIEFHGTGISIFGGRRPEYGTYSIAVDGVTIFRGDARNPEVVAQQLLGSTNGLSNGRHTAIFTSIGGPIDLDYVEIEAEVGPPGSEMNTVLYDDTDPKFSYLPSAAHWQTNTREEFMDGTLHFSSSPDAQASISFTGEALALYGTVSPDHADMDISLDGQVKTISGGSGRVGTLHAAIMLYYINGLDSSSEHTLTISRSTQRDGTGPFFDIDAVSVFSASGGSTVPSTTNTNGNSNQGDSSAPSTDVPIPSPNEPDNSQASGTAQAAQSGARSMPVSTIVAAAVGGFVGLVLITLLILFLLRRKRRSRAGSARWLEKGSISSPTSPDLPIQGVSEDPSNAAYGGIVENRLSPVRPPPPQAFPVSRQASIVSSYYGRNSLFPGQHSRESSVESNSSTAPMLPGDVPVIQLPRRPVRATVTSSYSDPYYAQTTQRPAAF